MSMEATGDRLPLSVLIDRMAGPLVRDEHFVRRFSAWFHEHQASVRLVPVETLGLVDVTLTFRMKRTVTLVVTGRHPDFPGAVTWHFAEAEFPFVWLRVSRTPVPEPYTVCTLDYSVAGRALVLVRARTVAGSEQPAGTTGRALVATTIGETAHVRATLDPCPDEPVNLGDGEFRFVAEAEPAVSAGAGAGDAGRGPGRG